MACVLWSDNSLVSPTTYTHVVVQYRSALLAHARPTTSYIPLVMNLWVEPLPQENHEVLLTSHFLVLHSPHRLSRLSWNTLKGSGRSLSYHNQMLLEWQLYHPAHSCRNITKKLCKMVIVYSFVPRLSWNANMYRGENLVSFLRKHDVGPKQKGNVLRIVQPTMLQCSVCKIFDAW